MAETSTTKAATEERDGFDPDALAALQSQINELKQQLVELADRPAAGADPVAATDAVLEDAVLEIADLFPALQLAVFRHDVRQKISRLTAAAAVVRERREAAAAKGNDDA